MKQCLGEDTYNVCPLRYECAHYLSRSGQYYDKMPYDWDEKECPEFEKPEVKDD